MRIVGFVVKALLPHERAHEARCYALGNPVSPWTSLRARAFVFTDEDAAKHFPILGYDGRGWAREHVAALKRAGCVPQGRRIVVVRLVRRTRAERAA